MHKFYWNLATNTICLKSSGKNSSPILDTNVSFPRRIMHWYKCCQQTAYPKCARDHNSV